jgi:GNAT superfamily N-acetyltransferase
VNDARSAHGNHREFWRQLARVCDGVVEEVPGGLVVETGIPATGFNQLHCGADADDAAAIDAAARYFDHRSLMWRIISERPSIAAEIFATRRGVEREPLYPILTRPVDGAVPPPATSLTLTRAGDVADLRAFVDCAAAGYRMDPALLKPLAHQRALAEDGLRFHLGLLDGRCVAVSVGVRWAATVGVYFVAVRRGFRRRGFGAAITWQAIRDAAVDGADVAVLQATTSGFPLYAGMGFGQVAEYHMWDLPG